MTDRPAPRRAIERKKPWALIVSLVSVVVLGLVAWIAVPYLMDSVGVTDQPVSESRGTLPDLTKKPNSKWKLAYSSLQENQAAEATVIDPGKDAPLVVVLPGKNGVVAGIDGPTGSVKFKSKIPDLKSCSDSPIATELVCISGGKAHLVSLKDGSTKTSFSIDKNTKDVAVNNGSIYLLSFQFGAQGSELPVVFSKVSAEGSEDWATSVTLAGDSPRPYLNYRFTKDYLVPGSITNDKTPIMLSLADGKPRAEKPAGAVSILANGDIAVSRDDGITLLSGSGVERFHTKGAEQPLSVWDKSPAALPQLVISDENGFLSLKGVTNRGRALWSLPGYLDAVSYCDSHLLAWNVDHDTVGAVDPNSGQIKWQAQVKSSGAAPLFCAGKVAVLATTDSAKAIDLSTGKSAWDLEISSGSVLLPSRHGALVASREHLELLA